MTQPIPDGAEYFLDEYDAERFWSHVNRHGGLPYVNDPLATAEGECWLWRGVKGDDYVRFKIGDRQYQAHWVAYRDFGNRVTNGYVVDHLCRVLICVNPAHLEAVPQAINVDRGRRSRRVHTACPRGHEFTPENTLWVERQGSTFRVCRSCERLRRAA